MNIVILTKHNTLFYSISECIDELIHRQHLKNMDLYSFCSPSLESLKADLTSCNCWLVFFDISSFPQWQSVMEDLSQQASCMIFCIICENNVVAAKLLNLPIASRIAGYINPASDCLYNSCQRLLDRFKTFSAINSSLILRLHGMDYVIPFSDIYYIDTQKGTHLCNLYHTNGIHTLRANICTLSQQLDWRFYPVRSSTIANLSRIQHLDIQNQLIYFSPDIFCSFSRANRKFLVQYFHLI